MKIEGWITTEHVDWSGHLCLVSGFAESLAHHASVGPKHPTAVKMLAHHDRRGRYPIGYWEKLEVRTGDDGVRGVYGIGEIIEDTRNAAAAELLTLLEADVRLSFSVGFLPEDYHIDEDTDLLIITKSRLLEASAVVEPCNPHATMQKARGTLSSIDDTLARLAALKG